MDKAAFIINSPFQALCAIEAKSHYKIVDADFIMFDTDICRNMVSPILAEKGKPIYIRHIKKGTIQLIKSVLNVIKEQYSIVFCGDYFSYRIYVVALSIIKRNGKLIYLDDGNSSLNISASNFRRRHRTNNERIGYRVLDFLSKAKHLTSSLFSLYDIGDNCLMPLEKNYFTSLVYQNGSFQSGIYVIGTNSSRVTLRGKTYIDYLSSLNNWIRRVNNDEVKIFYCPHRADKNDLSAQVCTLGWQMFDTEISVEVDFVRKGIYPVAVFGFGSTALLTLHKIFSKTAVYSIVLDYSSDKTNQTYRNIEKYYTNNGISVISVIAE